MNGKKDAEVETSLGATSLGKDGWWVRARLLWRGQTDPSVLCSLEWLPPSVRVFSPTCKALGGTNGSQWGAVGTG